MYRLRLSFCPTSEVVRGTICADNQIESGFASQTAHLIWSRAYVQLGPLAWERHYANADAHAPPAATCAGVLRRTLPLTVEDVEQQHYVGLYRDPIPRPPHL